MKTVDVAIIGAGAGGLTTAFTAKGFGKSVLLIDKAKPGGECTWSGCVPSKALINQANDIFTARKYSDFEVDTKKVMENVRAVIDKVYSGESPDVLEEEGVPFLQGMATFIGPKRIQVNQEEIQAKKIFICTGSSPMVPPIDGLKDVAYLTNETIFQLETLPQSMVILGAGAIGVELSQALNRIGVHVSLVEMADTILPREDKELTDMLKDKLTEEGVKIYTGHKAVKVLERDGQAILKLEGPEGKVEVEGSKLMLALGRVPNLQGLNLDKAQITYDRRGIEVNDYMETSSKGVYAVGDVTGKYMFSHMANAQGIQAVQNALLPINRRMKYNNVAWTTFTSPELATAGMTENQAREQYGDKIRVYRHDYSQLDRSKTKPGTQGMVKLILDSKGKVLGCSILGDRAGEIISEVQVVKSLGINFGKLGSVIHPYPTYGEVLQKIGKKVVVDNLLNHPLVKLFRK
jgi:pyruvate/2-oxoglutarate dehydrogenase complex dihydrolipoamide dehydrogenase (E3) component